MPAKTTYNAIRAVPARFEKVFGMPQATFDLLLNSFSSLKDRSRKLDDLEKVIGMIWLRRYGLTHPTFNQLILGGVRTSELDVFMRNVVPRFDAAVAKLAKPAQQRITQALAPVVNTKYIFNQLRDTDSFAAIAEQMQSTYGLSAKHLINDEKQWLENYLRKKPGEKKKTGQDHFLQMMNVMLFDVEEFTSSQEYLVWYMAVALQLGMHNSSHAPKPGYGVAQDREASHLNYYYRSQNDHPHVTFFKSLTATNKRAQCIAPRNLAFERLIQEDAKGAFSSKLKHYDHNGYVTADEKNEKLAFFSTSLAHSGLRTNNFNLYVQAIQGFLVEGNAESLIAKLEQEQIISTRLKRQIGKCPRPVLRARIEDLRRRFENMRADKNNSVRYDNMLHAMMTQRENRANQAMMAHARKGHKKISISADKNSSCVTISFYPGAVYPDNANYAEGVTNVLIALFAGLFNHHAELRGLQMRMDRRQSFGFTRTTVTDVGNMRMRLSLGLEPEVFDEVFTETAAKFEQLLTVVDFTNKKEASLKDGFVVSEKPMGEDVTDKTGIRFRTVMRSEAKKARAVDCAQACFNEAHASGQDLKHAVANYVRQLTQDGFGEVDIVVPPIAKPASEAVSVPKAERDLALVLKLLQNCIQQTLNAAPITELPAERYELEYGYWHVLAKLNKYCMKARALIDRAHEYPDSHVYAKARLLIEQMLEYLVVLDSIQLVRQKISGLAVDPVEALVKIEAEYTARCLNVSAENIDVFFVDSGQQAMTVSLFTMAMKVAQHAKQGELKRQVYVYPKCYYELNEFLEKDLSLDMCRAPTDASIIFVDITELSMLDLLPKKGGKAQVVIIDVTHNPSMHNPALKEIVKQLQKQGVWVVLAGSMLKHEQLGLDRNQAGKVVLMLPDGERQTKNIDDEFEAIAKAAMGPMVASYFVLIDSVLHEKDLKKCASPANKDRVTEVKHDEQQAQSIRKRM